MLMLEIIAGVVVIVLMGIVVDLWWEGGPTE